MTTLKNCARLLGVPYHKVYYLWQHGRFEARREGHYLLAVPDDVRRALEKQPA